MLADPMAKAETKAAVSQAERLARAAYACRPIAPFATGRPLLGEP